MSDKKDNFNEIASQASVLLQQNQETNWSLVCLNVLLIPTTLGALCLPTDDNSKAREKAVPDEWLKAVASLPNVSKEGLGFMTKSLSKKGFVSVQDAIDFVKIEKREMAAQQKIRVDQEKEQLQATGAAMLLARAEKELPGSIERFIEGTKGIVQAASGVAGFATETAVWLGKGLGTVVNHMRDSRSS